MLGGYDYISYILGKTPTPVNNNANETSLVEDTDYTESITERTISVCSCGFEEEFYYSGSEETDGDGITPSARPSTCSTCRSCVPDSSPSVSALSVRTTTTCSTCHGHFVNTNNEAPTGYPAVVERSIQSITPQALDGGEEEEEEEEEEANGEIPEEKEDVEKMKPIIVFKQRTYRTRPDGPARPEQMEFEWDSRGEGSQLTVPMSISVETHRSVTPSAALPQPSDNDNKTTAMIDEMVQRTIRVRSPRPDTPPARVVNKVMTDDEHLTNYIRLECEEQTLTINLRQDVHGITNNAAYVKGPNVGPFAITMDNHPLPPGVPDKRLSDFSFVSARSQETGEYQSTIDMEIGDEHDPSVREEEAGLPLESPLITDADTTPIPGVTRSARISGRKSGQLPEKVAMLDCPQRLSSIVESLAEDNDVTLHVDEAGLTEKTIQGVAERIEKGSREDVIEATRSYSESEIENTITIELEDADAKAQGLVTDASVNVLVKEGHSALNSVNSGVADLKETSPNENEPRKDANISIGTSERQMKKDEETAGQLSTPDEAHLSDLRTAEAPAMPCVSLDTRESGLTTGTTEKVVRIEAEVCNVAAENPPQRFVTPMEIPALEANKLDGSREPAAPAATAENMLRITDDLISSLDSIPVDNSVEPTDAPIEDEGKIDFSKPMAPFSAAENVMHLEGDEDDLCSLASSHSDNAISLQEVNVTEEAERPPSVNGGICPTVPEQIKAIRINSTRKINPPLGESAGLHTAEGPPLVSTDQAEAAYGSIAVAPEQCFLTEKHFSSAVPTILSEVAVPSDDEGEEFVLSPPREEDDLTVPSVGEGLMFRAKDSLQDEDSLTIDQISMHLEDCSQPNADTKPSFIPATTGAPENISQKKRDSTVFDEYSVELGNAPLTVETSNIQDGCECVCSVPKNLPESFAAAKKSSTTSMASSVESSRALQEHDQKTTEDITPARKNAAVVDVPESVVVDNASPLKPISQCGFVAAESRMESLKEDIQALSEMHTNVTAEQLNSKVETPTAAIPSVDSDVAFFGNEPPSREVDGIYCVEFRGAGKENPLATEFQLTQELDANMGSACYPQLSTVDAIDNPETSTKCQLTSAAAEQQLSENQGESLSRTEIHINVEIALRKKEAKPALEEPLLGEIQETMAVIEQVVALDRDPTQSAGKSAFPDDSGFPEVSAIVDRCCVGKVESCSFDKWSTDEPCPTPLIHSDEQEESQTSPGVDSCEVVNTDDLPSCTESLNNDLSGTNDSISREKRKGRRKKVCKVTYERSTEDPSLSSSDRLDQNAIQITDEVHPNVKQYLDKDFKGVAKEPNYLPPTLGLYLDRDFQGSAEVNPFKVPGEQSDGMGSRNADEKFSIRDPGRDIPMAAEQFLNKDFCGCAERNPFKPPPEEFITEIEVLCQKKEGLLHCHQTKEKSPLHIRLEKDRSSEQPYMPAVALDQTDSFDSDIIVPDVRALLATEFHGSAEDREHSVEFEEVNADFSGRANRDNTFAVAPECVKSIQGQTPVKSEIFISVDIALSLNETRPPVQSPLMPKPESTASTAPENVQNREEHVEVAQTPVYNSPAEASVGQQADAPLDKNETDDRRTTTIASENVNVQLLLKDSVDSVAAMLVESTFDNVELEGFSKSERSANVSEKVARSERDEGVTISTTPIVNQLPVIEESHYPLTDDQHLGSTQASKAPEHILQPGMENGPSQLSSIASEQISLDGEKSPEHVEKAQREKEVLGAPEQIFVEKKSSDCLPNNGATSFGLRESDTTISLKDELETNQSPPLGPDSPPPNLRDDDEKGPDTLFVPEDPGTAIHSTHVFGNETPRSERAVNNFIVKEALQNLERIIDSRVEGMSTASEHIVETETIQHSGAPDEVNNPTEAAEVEVAVGGAAVPAIQSSVSERAETHKEPESLAQPSAGTAPGACAPELVYSEADSSAALAPEMAPGTDEAGNDSMGSRKPEMFTKEQEQQEEEISSLGLLAESEEEEEEEANVDLGAASHPKLFEGTEWRQQEPATPVTAVQLFPVEQIIEITKESVDETNMAAEEKSQEGFEPQFETNVLAKLEGIEASCAEQIARAIDKEVTEPKADETKKEEEPLLTITVSVAIIPAKGNIQHGVQELISQDGSFGNPQELPKLECEQAQPSLVSNLKEERPEQHVEESMFNLQETAETNYQVWKEEETVVNTEVFADQRELAHEFSHQSAQHAHTMDLDSILETHGANELPRTKSEEAMFLARSNTSRTRAEVKVYTAKTICFNVVFPITPTPGLTVEECDPLELEPDYSPSPVVLAFDGLEDDENDEEEEAGAKKLENDKAVVTVTADNQLEDNLEVARLEADEVLDPPVEVIAVSSKSPVLESDLSDDSIINSSSITGVPRRSPNRAVEKVTSNDSVDSGVDVPNHSLTMNVAEMNELTGSEVLCDVSKFRESVTVEGTGTDDHVDMDVSVENSYKEEPYGIERLSQMIRVGGEPGGVSLVIDEVEADDRDMVTNMATASEAGVNVTVGNKLTWDKEGKTRLAQYATVHGAGANRLNTEAHADNILITAQVDTKSANDKMAAVANAVTGELKDKVKMVQVVQIEGSSDVKDDLAAELDNGCTLEVKCSISTKDVHADVTNILLNDTDGSTTLANMTQVEGGSGVVDATEGLKVESADGTEINGISNMTAFANDDTQIQVRKTVQSIPEGPTEVVQRIIVDGSSGYAKESLHLEKEGKPINMKSAVSVDVRDEMRVEVQHTVQRNFNPLSEAAIASGKERIAAMENEASSISIAQSEMEVKGTLTLQESKLGALMTLASIMSDELKQDSEPPKSIKPTTILDEARDYSFISDGNFEPQERVEKYANEATPLPLRQISSKSDTIDHVEMEEKSASEILPPQEENLWKKSTIESENDVDAVAPVPHTPTKSDATDHAELPAQEIASVSLQPLGEKLWEKTANESENDADAPASVPLSRTTTQSDTTDHAEPLVQAREPMLLQSPEEKLLQKESETYQEQMGNEILPRTVGGSTMEPKDGQSVPTLHSRVSDEITSLISAPKTSEPKFIEKAELEEVDDRASTIQEIEELLIDIKEVVSDEEESFGVEEVAEMEEVEPVYLNTNVEETLAAFLTVATNSAEETKILLNVTIHSINDVEEEVEPLQADVPDEVFIDATPELDVMNSIVEIDQARTSSGEEGVLLNLAEIAFYAEEQATNTAHQEISSLTNNGYTVEITITAVLIPTSGEKSNQSTAQVSKAPEITEELCVEEYDELEEFSQQPAAIPVISEVKRYTKKNSEGEVSSSPRLDWTSHIGAEVAAEECLDLFPPPSSETHTPEIPADHHPPSSCVSPSMAKSQVSLKYGNAPPDDADYDVSIETHESLSLPSLCDENFIVKARARVTTEIIASVDEKGKSVIQSVIPHVIIKRRRDASTPVRALVNTEAVLRSGVDALGPLASLKAPPQLGQQPIYPARSCSLRRPVATNHEHPRNTGAVLDLLITDTLASIKRKLGNAPQQHQNNHGVPPLSQSTRNPGITFSRLSRLIPGQIWQRPSVLHH